MAAQTMNVLLTPELKAGVNRRVRSGLYGNASDVIRAGLRALSREETRDNLKEFEQIMAGLPQDTLTPEAGESVERAIRTARQPERHQRPRRKPARG